MSDARSLSQHVSSALTQDQGHDELLRDACEGLWAHLEVLEWCVQQSRYVPVKPSPFLPYLGAHSILCSISGKKNDTISQVGIIVLCGENINNDQLPFATIVS